MTPSLPAALRPGDTIGIVAPAGVVDRTKLERAVQRLTDRGFRTKTYRDLFETRGYLAGSDAARIAELHAAFADEECRAVFPARGGCGCIRIVGQLDFDLVRAHPKIFLGFSDNTVLHAAFWHAANLVTFHGPHPCDSYGRPEGPTELTERWLWQTLMAEPGAHSGSYEISFDEATAAQMQTRVGGTAQGRLVGGNLALVCSLLGSPYELALENNILFLEDVNEPPYRIDRFLVQLKLAGNLERVAGIVLGQFTECVAPDAVPSLTLAEVLDDHLGPLNCPMLSGFPSGHGEDNVTLPLGVDVELDADRKRLTVLATPVRHTA
jgi:muramoyltetrapeptide carboxypeptidase